MMAGQGSVKIFLRLVVRAQCAPRACARRLMSKAPATLQAAPLKSGSFSRMPLPSTLEVDNPLAETTAAPTPARQPVKAPKPHAFDFDAAPRRMSAELAAELLIALLGAGGAAKAARREVRKARRARSKARHQFWSSVAVLAGEAADTAGNQLKRSFETSSGGNG